MSCLLTNILHLVSERSKLEKWTKFESMCYCKTIHFKPTDRINELKKVGKSVLMGEPMFP